MSGPENTDLRQAGPADVPAIRALVRSAYAKWVPVIGREPRPMLADYDEAILAHRFDVLEDQGGMIALIETEAREDHYWIENIAVAPEAQGRGIGRRLLSLAEELARANGFTELRLLTNALMAANIALYQKVGYVVEREEPFPGGGGSTVQLRKVLAA